MKRIKKKAGAEEAPTPKWAKNIKLKMFIEHLHLHGNKERACRAVNISRVLVWRHRNADPEFAQAVEDAIQCGNEALVDEAHRRAYEGILKPHYYKGEHCGLERVHSDTLLMFLIKKNDPSYRESYQVDIGNAGSRPFVFNMQLHPDAVAAAKEKNNG